MKKVLILTADKTGSGHKACSNAIEKKLQERGYETKQIDAFPLMGYLGNFMEASYIPVTTKAPYAFYFGEQASEFFPGVFHTQIYFGMRKNLLKEIQSYQPDLIISVQTMFTKAVSRLIREYDLHIPFYIGVIDLIDPPTIWMDTDADVSFVPSEAIRRDYLSKGFREDQVVVSGFPVRDDIVLPTEPKKVESPIHILMVNPSTDLKKNIHFLREVSRLDNITVDFICGLNEELHKTLTAMKEEGELPDFVNIHGFVSNMNDFLADAHIIMTKAGPNVIIESLRSGTAVVITGHIQGQENNNYRFVTDHDCGFKCEDPEEIYEQMKNFIETDALQECLKNAFEIDIRNGAEIIADYVKEHI